MFWRREKRAEPDREKAHYERDLRRVYKYNKLTLAIARMSYFVGYNVNGENRTDTFRAIGVVHEQGQHERHLPCELEFVDADEKDGTIGWCELTQYDASSERDEGNRVEGKPMMLDVKIYDAEQKYRYLALSAIRDAAISGNRFTHFEIGKKEIDVASVDEQIRDKGYGPSMSIHSLKIWPEIILPKAPTWGWKGTD